MQYCSHVSVECTDMELIEYLFKVSSHLTLYETNSCHLKILKNPQSHIHNSPILNVSFKDKTFSSCS